MILPDCRGHGQSTNPNRTYSFREHAADLAALVRALGFERVHVVGHSNGGNIALVMLLEEPQVVQTCVIQAGNAWVSPDLIEKEPRIFEPAFIERERPFWARNLKEMHGPEYWRDLVKLTVAEIISQPNYTPEDLAKAAHPTLVVQGAEDSVNAPMQHGEFMAKHIPDAELWVPKGVGHTVHEEVLNEWLARIPRFWERRGSEPAEALHRYASRHHADERNGPFELRIVDGTLQGTVLDEAMRDEAAAVTSLPADKVQVLITPETPWARVKRPVDDLWRGPGSLSERVSQLRLGEAVRILDQGPEWSRVHSIHDRYTGWIHTQALHRCTAQEAEAWGQACNAIVTAPLAEALDAEGAPFQRVAFATLVPVVRAVGGFAWIQLPDGREWRLRAEALRPLVERPQADEAGIAEVLGFCRRFLGVPYLWGGRTPYGFDCSGLAGTFYACLGIAIPRDADQQFTAGEPVDGPLQPGDLLFFGEALEQPGPDDRGYVHEAGITHVALSLGGADFLHASGANWGIACNSLDPASPVHDPRLLANYRGARRFRARP